MSKRAAIYCRISKDTQDGEGVERQEELCRKRAEQEGWDVVRVFTDNDITAAGKAKKRRPAYEDLMSAAEAGEFDVVVSYSMSRLTRRPLEWERILTLAAEGRPVFRFIQSGEYDLTKSEGRATARTVAAWDAREAEHTSEKVLDAQRKRRAEGNVVTRRAFGWQGNELIPVEAEAIRTATAEVLKGVSTSEIARRWNAQGVPTVKAGAVWRQARVVEILVRWRNAGVIVHRGTPVEGVSAPWEPVVDRPTLERVRTLLLDPARRTMTVGRPPTALMSATALCGACGQKMVASKVKSSDGRDRPMYRCSGAMSTTGAKCYLGISRPKLDDAVRHEVRWILAFEAPEGLVPSKEDQERLGQIQEQRAALTGEERELGRLMGSGKLSVTALSAALEGVQGRREELDREADTIRDRALFADLFAEVLVGSKVDMDALAEVGRRFNALTIPQQRQVVKRLVTVTVHPGRGDDRVEIVRNDS